MRLLWLWLHSPEVLTLSQRLDPAQVSHITQAADANGSIVVCLLLVSTCIDFVCPTVCLQSMASNNGITEVVSGLSGSL